VRIREYNEEAERAGAPVQYRGAVISVHGMTTRGAWQKDIHTAMQDAVIRHKSVDFGWRLFGVVRRGTCDRVAEQILRAYEEQIRFHSTPSALGHSFGSLAIGRALKIFPDVRLNRVILFGSILAPDYPWNQIHANGQVQAVLTSVPLQIFGQEWRSTSSLTRAPPGGGFSGRRRLHH
jgi:hypothetical protein